MAINTVLYFPTNAGAWREQATNTVTRISGNVDSHSERWLYNNRSNNRPLMLFVQDAFPCAICHDFFIQQSAGGRSIIFKITANNGGYSGDHTYPNSNRNLNMSPNISCSFIIYYHAGESKRVSLSTRGKEADPMDGFPEFPAIEDYY